MEMRIEPPTDYYDEQLQTVDENIVASIATRQRLSNGKPGFPKAAYLERWARQYEIPVSILHQTFSALFRWHVVRERLQPDQFKRFVAIMAAEPHGNLLVLVPYLRQYNNCSVVSVQLESPQLADGPVHVDLEIAGYECLRHGGGGSQSYWHQEFVVTPVIPDDEATALSMIVHIESGNRMWGHRVGEPAPEPIPPTTIRFHPNSKRD